MNDGKLSSGRVEMSVAGLQEDYSHYLRYTLAKDEHTATARDRYMAFAFAIRDRITERWMETQAEYHRQNAKYVYYLSLEFLIGRLLGNNVINLKADQLCRDALRAFGLDWNTLRDFEMDAGLGNGGLGRLAACYLDSMSTLDLAAMGYGIRYDYGIFRQRIVDGQQVEEPDHWLKDGYPWEIARPEYAQTVSFGGHVDCTKGEDGALKWEWKPDSTVQGVPYDLPIVGYNHAVNTLRLWSARALDEFDLADFNQGSYVAAVETKVLAENLTKVLYPNDNTMAGKELRLKQQYFFVACSLRDILRRFRQSNDSWDVLPEKAFIHLNETHPALVIPELMRILVDEEGLEWNRAWDITRRSTGYTNHTILPEALEKWSVRMMETLLPRHLQIIYEINSRFLKELVGKIPVDQDRIARMSLIDEHGERYVRMANMCIVGSSSTNGVAKLHSEILKKSLFKDFYELYPERFTNVTNGITPRRWLLKANPSLSQLISETIGTEWITHLEDLRMLEQHGDDEDFLCALEKIKGSNKRSLARYVKECLGEIIDPNTLFDVQVKRLHEYKRQLMLALYIIMRYNRIVSDPSYNPVPRTFIFAAKAAPGYWMAKLIIRFIHDLAKLVNGDPRTRGLITVVFLPDYRVSLAERIMPAAELSEQISLAGMEASGTGNMKFMINGALTIGTYDGANVEIHEQVGDDNMFLFGMRAEDVARLRPSYNARECADKDPEIGEALRFVKSGAISPGDPSRYEPILRSLLDYNDYYMLIADLRSYADTHDKVDATYLDRGKWNHMSLVNMARSGFFSSDRAVAEYARNIWHVAPVMFG